MRTSAPLNATQQRSSTMERVFGLLILALLSPQSAGSTLRPATAHYNVLFLSLSTSRSHSTDMLPLAEALGKRGHNVTVLGNYKSNPLKRMANVSVLHHGLDYVETTVENFFDASNPLYIAINLPLYIWRLNRDLYEDPVVKELYQRRYQFDVVIVDMFFEEITYPFVHGKPFIAWVMCGNNPIQSMLVGNLQNPAVGSSTVLFHPVAMDMFYRVRHLLASVIYVILRNIILLAVQYRISSKFPDLPSLSDIAKSQSLAFLFSQPITYGLAPLLPGQVQVDCLQCRPGRALPADLLKFVSTDVPVIYVSFGTLVQSEMMSRQHRDLFLAAFRKLPYRFIWKYGEDLPCVSDNVLLRDHLPQQDLLAHPNVRLFITHSDISSTQEAIYHSTPMLGMPVFHDQFPLAARMQSQGLGLVIHWNQLSERLLIDSIKQLMSNSSYTREARKRSVIRRDQLMSPVDTAVFWTEFVVRHHGAPHLCSGARDVSLDEILNLDVILLLVLVGALVRYKVQITRMLMMQARST